MWTIAALGDTPLAGDPVILELTSSPLVAIVESECGQTSAAVTVDDANDTIKFETFGALSGRFICPPDRDAQLRRVLQALASTDRWEIDDLGVRLVGATTVTLIPRE